MRILFTSILFLTLVLNAKSQDAVVLDNSKENQPIFDSNDPLSLISIVKANAYYLGHMEIEGMSDELRQNLSEADRNQILQFRGQPGTVPITDTDPNSPRFGKPLIVTDPTTGMQSFVYDAPDTVFTLLDEIDRIVIEFEPEATKTMENASRLSYFKRIDGSYQKVLSVNASDLLSLDGLGYFRLLDDPFASGLLSDDSNSLWNVLRNEALKQHKLYDGSKFSKWTYDLKLHQFPADAIQFGFFNWSEPPASMGQWEKEREVFYVDYISEIGAGLYPFELNLGSGIVSDTSGRAQLLASFEGVYSDFEISDTPLIDRDPNSPNFGNELMTLNEDGTLSYQYPDPKEVFFWMDYTDPKIFVKESFHTTEDGTVVTTDAVYFTIEVNGKDEVISVIPFRESIQEFFGDYKPISADSLPFRQLLDEAFQNDAFHFNLSEPSTRKTLKLDQ